MSEVHIAKTEQLSLNSEDKTYKSGIQSNGTSLMNGQKDSNPPNPWKSNTSSLTPTEKPKLEQEWPSITNHSKPTDDQPPAPRNSSTQVEDKKKAKPQWVQTNIPLTYRPANRPGPPPQQAPRGSGFGARPRRTHLAGRPTVPRAPNGFAKSAGPRQGIPRSFSKEDTSSAAVDAQKDIVDHSEQASIKSNSPPIKNEIRRNGNSDANPSDHSLSTRINSQKERPYAHKSGRKNTEDNVKIGPFEAPLIPFGATAPALGLLNDPQILLRPIMPDISTGFAQQMIHPIPQTAAASMPTQVMGEVVDLAQVISTIEKFGWDKAQLPQSLRDDPEILKAQARAGFVRGKEERSTEATSRQPKNDVVIVDSRIFFVSKSQFNTKFVKFTSKLDYIRHHLGYYFSDSNLTRDNHLQKILETNNEACPVRDLLQFNRLRIVNTTETELLEAAANCNVVQVSTMDEKTCLIPLKRLAKVNEVPASDVMPIMQPLFLAPQPALFDQSVAPTSTVPDSVTSPLVDQAAVSIYPVFTSAPDTDSVEASTTHATSSSAVSTSVAQPQVSSPVTATAPPQNGIPVSMPMLGLPPLSNILISQTNPALHPFGYVPQQAMPYQLLSSNQAGAIGTFPATSLLRLPATHPQASMPQMQFSGLWFPGPAAASHPQTGAIFAPPVSAPHMYAAADPQQVFLAAQRGMTPGHPTLLQGLVSPTQGIYSANPLTGTIGPNLSLVVNQHGQYLAAHQPFLSTNNRFMQPQMQQQQQTSAGQQQVSGENQAGAENNK